MELETIFAQLEKQIELSNSERAKLFSSVCDAFDKTQTDTEEYRKAVYDLWAWQAVAVFPTYGDERFGEHSFYPVSLFTSETVAHFAERAKLSKNPVHQARYADLVVEFGARYKQNVFEHALTAIDAYVKIGSLFPDRDDLTVEDALLRAFVIAIKFGQLDRLTKIVDCLRLRFEENMDNLRHGAAIMIVQGLLKAKKPVVPNTVFETIVNGLVKYADSLEKDPEKQDVYRVIVNLIAEIYKKIGNPSAHDDFISKIPGSLIREADWSRKHRSPGNLMARDLYNEALTILLSNGSKDTATIQRLKTLIDECTEIAVKTEIGTVTVPIEIPHDTINAELEKLKKLVVKDRLDYFARSDVLSPDMSVISASVDEMKTLSPLKYRMVHSSIRGHQKVGIYVSEEERRKAFKQQALRWHIMYSGLIWSILFRKSVEEGLISVADIHEYIMVSELVGQEKAEFVKRGVERYLEGDYISAIHILVPHLEDILRKVSTRCGESSTAFRPDGTAMESQPSSFMNRPALAHYFGTAMIEALKNLLFEKEGFNLRHDVAHGVISDTQCDHLLVSIVIHAYMRIASSKKDMQSTNLQSSLQSRWPELDKVDKGFIPYTMIKESQLNDYISKQQADQDSVLLLLQTYYFFMSYVADTGALKGTHNVSKLLFTKASSDVLAVHSCLKNGCLYQAAVVLRSLFETRLTTEFIYQDFVARADLFYDYKYVEQFEAMQREKSTISPSRRNFVRRKYAEIGPNYKRHSPWYYKPLELLIQQGKVKARTANTRSLAKSVGLLKDYESLYHTLSSFTHGSSVLDHTFMQDDTFLVAPIFDKQNATTLAGLTVDYAHSVVRRILSDVTAPEAHSLIQYSTWLLYAMLKMRDVDRG